MVVSGIGCSSNLPGYIHAYGFHGLHGRALAQGTDPEQQSFAPRTEEGRRGHV
jgi:pyruvate/2-oxoacid:ferredoxin oxidoreductase beta subunit